MKTFQLLQKSAEEIDLMSALSSLLFALVIYALLKNARILRAKKWATPFADTFLVLAVLYLLIFASHFPLPPNYAYATKTRYVLTLLCSGVTNYLFLLSVFLLSAPAMNQKRVSILKKQFVGRPYIKSPILWLLCLVALSAALGTTYSLADALVSAAVLLLMGSALYTNRVRTDRFMAWLALISSIVYAAVYLLTEPVIFDNFTQRILSGDLGANIANTKGPLTSLILLIGKFGFFFSGYSLMLSISGPLQGIERLMDNVLHGEKEYLESDGIVRSTCEELGLKRVSLYIELPGSKDRHLALYDFPSTNTSRPQEPRIFPYRKGEFYDLVMTSKSVQREHRENSFHWLFPAPYKIGVPVFFHDSVTACLVAEVGKEKFTEGNRINLERMVNLISPAVQTYREMSALNQLSQDLTELQIRVIKYDLDKHFQNIAERIYKVTSPTIVGISIETGFGEYLATYPQQHQLAAETRELLSKSTAHEDFLSSDGSCRWLSKRLTIPKVLPTGEKTGEQVFGNFILGIDQRHKSTNHPTIGTNPTCFRALSDLMTDTLLDFVRGHLNQLTDKLGERLSGLKGTTVDGWLKEIQKTAKEARLLWVVARFSGDEENFFGDEDAVGLVKSLERPEKESQWSLKEDFWLCKLDPQRSGTTHLIRKALKNSKATLWLGLDQNGFGEELDYVSPWQYFLIHFCEIADSSLVGIQSRRNQVLLYSTVVTEHQLVNLAKSLTTPFTALENAVRQGRLKCSKNHRDLIESYKPTVIQIEKLLKVGDHDERQPCSLQEVFATVLEVANGNLKQHNIKLEFGPVPEVQVDVPFYVATHAISIVLDNAKDAIRFSTAIGGLIRIEIDDTDKIVVCSIFDSGPGVDPNIARKLFVEPSPSAKSGSNGLGLFSAGSLLRAFDANIVHVTPRPEPETLFRLEFPLMNCADEQ